MQRSTARNRLSSPRFFMRQHRSISSICAKKRGSNPFNLWKRSALSIRQAPEAQKISEVSLYCCVSFSKLVKIRPLQKGYPKKSINPPAAPAYSNLFLSLKSTVGKDKKVYLIAHLLLFRLREASALHFLLAKQLFFFYFCFICN